MIYSQPSLEHKIVVLFFVVMAAAGLINFLRSWLVLRPLGRTGKRMLAEFTGLLQNHSQNQLPEKVSAFPSGRPESGVRRWAELSSRTDLEPYLRMTGTANADFCFLMGRVGAIALSLKRWLVLAVLVCCYFIAQKLSVIGKSIEPTKAIGIGSLTGELAEMLDVLSGGLLVMAATFLVLWVVSYRIQSRKRIWEQFYRRVQSLSASD